MSASPTNSNGQPHPKQPLIYVVDDEPMLLELTVLILQSEGVRIETYRDPLAAVRAFSLANPLPDLIITDFAMHRMNGLDLIRDCRVIHPRQKILMVSGTVDESIYQSVAHQPDAFLAKPYSTTQLKALVNNLLGR